MKVLLTATVAGLLLVSGVVEAQTRYVSDQLEVMMRRGEGVKFRVLRSLKSGTPVEVLEINQDSGYTKIRAPGGKEGYVLSRYLMRKPSARQQLSNLVQGRDRMQSEKVALQEMVSALEEDTKRQGDAITQLQQDKQTLQGTLERLRKDTADVVAISNHNQVLTQDLEATRTQLRLLQEENSQLSDSTRMDWFVRGAGAVLVGILLGILLPKLRRQKRGWSDL